MIVNKINLSDMQFADFLQRLARDPFSEIATLSSVADHTIIRISGSNGQTSKALSLHVVSDNAVYHKFIDLPRADYLRKGMTPNQETADLFWCSPEEHHARKDEMWPSF